MLKASSVAEMTAPSISIIIATYNAATTVQRLLDSIRTQSNQDFELIVIDGGSTDQTVQALQNNIDIITYWVSEPDQGIYDAWNKGVKKATGRWLCFIGADDYLYSPDVLAKMKSALADLPDQIRIAYGQIALINTAGDELYRLGEPWENLQKRFRGQMCVPHPATLHRRDLFETNGLFDPAFRIAGDYEFLLRELLHNQARFVPGVVMVAMQVGGISSNPEHSKRQLDEVRKAQKIHGITSPPLNWIFASLRVWLRLALWRLIGEANTRRLLDIGRALRGLPPHWSRTR